MFLITKIRFFSDFFVVSPKWYGGIWKTFSQHEDGIHWLKTLTRESLNIRQYFALESFFGALTCTHAVSGHIIFFNKLWAFISNEVGKRLYVWHVERKHWMGDFQGKKGKKIQEFSLGTDLLWSHRCPLRFSQQLFLKLLFYFCTIK